MRRFNGMNERRVIFELVPVNILCVL